METVRRCAWAARSGPLEMVYHDEQWGVPVHDDRALFEMLVLEGAQAGLSWSTILRKRQAYVEAFDGFQPEVVARYDAGKMAELLANPGIVRNRLKIEAAVANARHVLEVRERHGSFDVFIWRFVDGQPIANAWTSMADVPASTRESDAMSRELRRLGFRFVGTTICYAYMQSVGMANDHTTDCFRWAEVAAQSPI